jgi:hypothetical protein
MRKNETTTKSIQREDDTIGTTTKNTHIRYTLMQKQPKYYQFMHEQQIELPITMKGNKQEVP